MKLFCFPYAGGSSQIYKEWQNNFSSDIAVIPFEMAGKRCRLSEKPYQSHADAAEKILLEIKKDLSSPYSLFGHSMGAVIVFILAHEIVKQGLPQPEHVFLSARKPPHISDEDDGTWLLPETEFIKVLKKYGKTPGAVFSSKEMLDYFMPILRNDFMLAEFDKSFNFPQLDIELTVFYGLGENMSEDDALDWNRYSSQECSVFGIPGDHFFIDENKNEVIRRIEKKILDS